MMMKTHTYPGRDEWEALCTRPTVQYGRLAGQVRLILEEVKKEGDQALRRLTRKFDGCDLSRVEVDREERESSSGKISEELKDALALASGNIRRFHASQRRTEEWVETCPGVRCLLRSVPVEKVGLYIPGGTAPLFSTVLMLAIPAALAGCSEVILCTPPRKDGSVHPAILYAAMISGVHRVFRVGGAQAIAAMAYGTETIPAVDKIFGPGNQYVTLAKQFVSMEGVAIDLPAGPSELAVMADQTANPAFVAADLLSQAEHGTDSQVILVTDDPGLPGKVSQELRSQIEILPRKEIAAGALENSLAIVLGSAEDRMEFINQYAPEHLIIMTRTARKDAEKIRNAGSVFLGPYSPESAGDYASGTNHTLPTNGFARSWSGLSLDSFLRTISFQEITAEGLQGIGPAIETMAAEEQLEAHRRAVAIRLNQK